MDDWERHFAEKSRRRAEKEDRERRKRRLRQLIVGTGISVVLAGSIIALAMLR